MSRNVVQIIFFLGFLSVLAKPASSQYIVRGVVYDSSHFPLELATVLSTSGKGTYTNRLGEYQIEVGEKDSIWFSYLGKPTIKFPVLKIADPFNFEVSLKVNVPELREVLVARRNYRQDSLSNREEYAKIFNYEKPKLRAVTPQYGAAAGFDLDEIINMFRFKRNRSMLSFQKRLLLQEQDKFIDHRFSKALVRRLTNLDGNELDSFMTLYRPPYFFVTGAGDYDFQKYIKDSFERFNQGLPPLWIFKPEDGLEN
ncbi:MAG: hypothetical protein ABI480_05790 [Chitinophagaceae bacterium]